MLTNSYKTALTRCNFEMLLNWLDDDREIAGQKYEAIRFRLQNFFYLKGCAHTEELADETIDRVMKKVEILQSTYIGNPALYFTGVAKKVFLEYKRRRTENELPVNLKDLRQFENNEIENLHFCLNKSLNQIPAKQREFIIEYYSGAKNDKIQRCRQISPNKNISQQAIRVQAFRIRAKLQRVFLKNLSQI